MGPFMGRSDGQNRVKDMVTEIGQDIYSPAYRIPWAMAESASLSGNNLEQLCAMEKPSFMDWVMLPYKSTVNRKNYDLEKWADKHFSLRS
eukprot:scaffold21733_cov53-Attheya_sp.AAC.2